MKDARRHQNGYVFRKGNTWYLRYREPFLQPDGTSAMKQKCRQLAKFGGDYRSKTAVKKLADEFLIPINTGAYTPMSGTTVLQFVESAYLPYVKENKRPSTYNGYCKLWNRYLRDVLNVTMRDFRTHDCEVLLRQVKKRYDVGSRTIAHVKNFLSGVFRYAIRTGTLNGVNPVRETTLPPARAPRDTHAYAVLEIVKMLAVLPTPARTLVATAAFTGLRKGEIRGLKPVDYDGQVLHVRRSVWRKHVGDPKGKRGSGAVPVIRQLAEILNAHMLSFPHANYLFESERKGPADLDYVSRAVIVPTLMEAGICWHGWHAFRRGLATNLHEIGVSDIVIQAILRHSDVAVTRESYIKRNGVDRRSTEAMRALEAHLCNQSATLDASIGSIRVVQ